MTPTEKDKDLMQNHRLKVSKILCLTAWIMTSPTDIKINLSKHGNSFPQES